MTDIPEHEMLCIKRCCTLNWKVPVVLISSRADPTALTYMIKPIQSKELLIRIVAAAAGTKFPLCLSTTQTIKISM